MTETCRQLDDLIARSGRLTSNETELLQAHLATCSACRDLARALEPVDADLDHLDDLDDVGDPHTSDATRDRYRITGEVGRGGIGRVLEALDQVLDRTVALKELFSEDPKLRRRFVREALITARLQHPSIVPVYDAGHLGDRAPFYAMKLVAGQPLDASIEEAKALAERLALLPRVLAVADAMAYAHSRRIIHRDLKPANVLVGAFGETIVIDWGLAKDLAIDGDDGEAADAAPYRLFASDHTAAGVVLGTPAYMAPEQASRATVDERADVYALGAILYHVVSGVPPHEGATLDELVARVTAGDVRPITEREPTVARDLAAIITKAMALAPTDRYTNAGGLADDLRRFLTGQLVASHTYGLRELVRRWLKRHRAAVTVAITAFVILAVVGITSILRVVDEREHADEQRTIAEREKTTATQALANLLEEQGRQELLAGRSTRAIAYLSEAYEHTPSPGIALRSLLAKAMHAIEAERLTLQHGANISGAAFSPDGAKVVTAGTDDRAKVWNASTGALVATLTGHDDAITSVTFSPDSTRIVTASADQTARVWDARTGAVLATLRADAHLLLAAFSPDGARLVTTGEAGKARLWNATTGELTASLEGHHQDIYAAAFSPDGSRVVTASDDHTAKIWDAATGKLQRSLEGHSDDVMSTSFSPDGSQIVTASADHSARIWNAQTGTLVATLTGHTDSVNAAAFSADGTRIVTAGRDHAAKLWDAHTGALVLSLDGHTGSVTTAAFSADGTRIVTASDDRTTKLWDARAGSLVASFEGHRDEITAASFRPDGTEILTASADGTAKLWTATSSNARIALTGTSAGPVQPERGALSTDGSKLVTIAEHDSSAKLWDARTGKLVASLVGHHDDVTSARFDPAGTHVVTASNDHAAKVWDATTGKLLVSLDHPDAVKSAAFTADGKRIVSDSGEQRVWIWNATTGALIAHFERGPGIYPVRVTKDGMRILVVNMFGGASIHSVDTHQIVATLEGSATPIYAAAFSLDGERVATASVDRTVKVWNARTGQLVASLDGTTRHAFGGWFSPDGARVITVNDDNTAHLWDATTGKLVASYDGHRGDISNVGFSPDGGRVLTTSKDRTAKLWDERSGKLLASFDARTDELLDSTFSRDGTHIILANGDGSIWIWDAHLEQRTPDEIHRIVSTRNPWTLSHGVLVPDATRGNR